MDIYLSPTNALLHRDIIMYVQVCKREMQSSKMIIMQHDHKCQTDAILCLTTLLSCSKIGKSRTLGAYCLNLK